MVQQLFAQQAATILKEDPNVIGLAVGGSWLSGEMDEFSDLDLILVTKHKLSDQKSKMLAYADRLGNLLSGFTGEHVGESRVLICLYDDPLLHVDIKFLTIDELNPRIENPHILFQRDNQLQQAFDQSEATFPYPDYQWIEDRFWTWVHYALLKIGRGELMEAFDFLAYLRLMVFGPLLHIQNGNLPRGVRKVETSLRPMDFKALKYTIPDYDKQSILNALKSAIALYRSLRSDLFKEGVAWNRTTEEKVMGYLDDIVKR
ncbi:MAG: nucleotidyltransferase domain-containing protein [Bacteroidota bacterium]